MFSEYCFPNIYLFRHVHDYRFVPGPRPVIRGATYDGATVVMPLFDVAQASLDELRTLLAGADCFYPVDAERTRHLDPQRIDLHWNDADADYIYRTERLALYEGAELKEKRRLSAKFVREAAPVTRPFDASALDDGFAILDQWFADVEKPWAETDYRACREALEHWQALGLFGVICHTGDGEPAGFLLASKVRRDVAAVHFAKGKRKFDGVFPHMFNQLAATAAAEFTYLNFEQDLGKEGFRQSKRSYAPEFMLRKYRLSLR